MTTQETPEYISVTDHTAVKIPEDVANMLRRVDDLESKSQELHAQAKQLKREAVATLKNRRWKTKEIAAVLGVVPQRVWQIFNDTY